MRIKKKLKNQKGFSLAETLLAVLILLLVSVIVANGIPVARNVYNNVIVGANAQVLLSTAVNALRNELGTAQKVDVDNSPTIIYYKASIGAYSQLSIGDGTEGIQLLDYVYQDPADKEWKALPRESTEQGIHALVSNAASNKNLFVTYESVARDTVNKDVLVFSNIEVKRMTSGNPVVASLETLKIRLIPVSPTDA